MPQNVTKTEPAAKFAFIYRGTCNAVCSSSKLFELCNKHIYSHPLDLPANRHSIHTATSSKCLSATCPCTRTARLASPRPTAQLAIPPRATPPSSPQLHALPNRPPNPNVHLATLALAVSTVTSVKQPTPVKHAKRRLASVRSSSLFGQNETLVCHKQPSAVRTTYVDCDVKQPTVNTFYPVRCV